MAKLSNILNITFKINLEVILVDMVEISLQIIFFIPKLS